MRRARTLLRTVALAVLAGCDRPHPVPSSGAASWYEIAQAPGIRAYLDTGRIEHATTGASRVWMRFVYTTPIALGADTTTYRAMETRQEIDCAKRRTRGLELRMETAAGVIAAAPTPDGQWSSLDTHPLNSGVFLVACRAAGTPIPAHPAS